MAATGVLKTTDVPIPEQIINAIIGKVQYGSALAQLAQHVPMKFGTADAWTADIGEAELVGEAANKGASSITPTTVKLNQHKFVKTLRFSDELQWADEDVQLGVVDQLADLLGPALARALDYGAIHGLNPLAGTVSALIVAADRIASTSISSTLGSDPVANLDAAESAVIASGYVPSGVALDPALAAAFRAKRDTNGKRIYPDFKLTTAISDLDGFTASVSKTVGAVGVATTATNLKAIVGDFSQFVWGIQREVGLEPIYTGDPDGQGDLKRNNEIAIRAEIVYGWGIADLNAFAKLVTSSGGQG